MESSAAANPRTRRLPAAAAVALLAVGALFSIPHRPPPSQQARIGELKARVSALRDAVDLYYHQHGHRYPGEYDPTDGTTPFQNGQEAAAATAFVQQLTRYTDRQGRTSSRKSTRFPLGPYLPSDTLPDNPLLHGAAAHQVQIDFSQTRPYTAYPPDGRKGWRYYMGTGRLAADDRVRVEGQRRSQTADVR